MGVQAPPYPHALFPRPQNVPRKDVNRWLQWWRRTLQPLSRKRSPAKAALVNIVGVGVRPPVKLLAHGFKALAFGRLPLLAKGAVAPCAAVLVP